MSTRWGDEQQTGKGVPDGWYTWYDWVLVYRYWTGDAAGLRKPYLLEIRALMRLGAELTPDELAERFGLSRRTIERWREKTAA
jgi:hypothetical protein